MNALFKSLKTTSSNSQSKAGLVRYEGVKVTPVDLDCFANVMHNQGLPCVLIDLSTSNVLSEAYVQDASKFRFKANRKGMSIECVDRSNPLKMVASDLQISFEEVIQVEYGVRSMNKIVLSTAPAELRDKQVILKYTRDDVTGTSHRLASLFFFSAVSAQFNFLCLKEFLKLGWKGLRLKKSMQLKRLFGVSEENGEVAIRNSQTYNMLEKHTAQLPTLVKRIRGVVSPEKEASAAKAEDSTATTSSAPKEVNVPNNPDWDFVPPDLDAMGYVQLLVGVLRGTLDPQETPFERVACGRVARILAELDHELTDFEVFQKLLADLCFIPSFAGLFKDYVKQEQSPHMSQRVFQTFGQQVQDQELPVEWLAQLDTPFVVEGRLTLLGFALYLTSPANYVCKNLVALKEPHEYFHQLEFPVNLSAPPESAYFEHRLTDYWVQTAHYIYSDFSAQGGWVSHLLNLGVRAFSFLISWHEAEEHLVAFVGRQGKFTPLADLLKQLSAKGFKYNQLPIWLAFDYWHSKVPETLAALLESMKVRRLTSLSLDQKLTSLKGEFIWQDSVCCEEAFDLASEKGELSLLSGKTSLIEADEEKKQINLTKPKSSHPAETCYEAQNPVNIASFRQLLHRHHYARVTRDHQSKISCIRPLGSLSYAQNYEPSELWSTGAQLVGLIQGECDLPNIAFLGLMNVTGCLASNFGYALKPNFLRQEAFDPDSYFQAQAEIPGRNDSYHLKIKILKTRLLPAVSEGSNAYVSAHVWGFPTDTQSFKTAGAGNSRLVGTFKDEFEFKVKVPQLAVLGLVVHQRRVFQDTIEAFYSFPLTALKQGYRMVPLYDNQFTQIPLAGMLIHVSLL